MNSTAIGIVGVGHMGHGIAINIVNKGWSLGFLNHHGNQPVDDLLEAGAAAHDSLAELAAACDVIIICVTGSPEVEEVLTRQDGLLTGLKKGAVVIDCSTAIPTSTMKLASLVEAAGARFLDAPMTRTPKEAAEGRLNLIVGGDKTLFESQLPLMQTYAENITYAGPVGSGHTMKLLHNFVSLGFSAVLAEAAAASNRAGVEPAVLHDVLAHGGGAGVVLDRMAPFILEGESGGLKFSLSNCEKDIGYYANMCDDLQAEQGVAQAVLALFATQVGNGNGELFVPELIRLLAQPT